MFAPLAAIAANVATNALDNLLSTATTKSANALSSVGAAQPAFADAFASATDTSINSLVKKLLQENPAMANQLGKGPITLAYNEGRLTLTNTAGTSVDISATSATATKTYQLAQSLGLKKFEKVLESAMV